MIAAGDRPADADRFGTLAATLNFIPIVGPVAMIAVLAVVGVVTGATSGMGLLPAALFMLVVFVEGQFITPAIIGRKIEINALAVLLSLMFWTLDVGTDGRLPVLAAADRRPHPARPSRSRSALLKRNFSRGGRVRGEGRESLNERRRKIL